MDQGEKRNYYEGGLEVNFVMPTLVDKYPTSIFYSSKEILVAGFPL